MKASPRILTPGQAESSKPGCSHPLAGVSTVPLPDASLWTYAIACRVLSSLESKHLSVKSAAVLETVLVIAMAIVLVPATRNW